jgi:hypothetical protein
LGIVDTLLTIIDTLQGIIDTLLTIVDALQRIIDLLLQIQDPEKQQMFYFNQPIFLPIFDYV